MPAAGDRGRGATGDRRQPGRRRPGGRSPSRRSPARQVVRPANARRANARRPVVEHLVQFPPGLTELVRLDLAQRPGWRETFADDSALLFTCRDPIVRADALPMAKAVFRVWARTGRGSLGRALTRLAETLPADIRPERPDSRGFRVMVQIDGALTAVPAPDRRRLEQALASATGQRPAPRGGNTEYWVLGRRDLPDVLLAQKVPRRQQPTPVRGALAPELAAALVAASRPRATDRFLDPFGGSGALVKARVAQPAASIAYGDLDLATHRESVAELRGRPGVRILADDALVLPSIADGSIDAVVTDPPWGEHEPTDPPYPAFAQRMAASLARVLAPEGRLVLLIARRRADEAAASLTDAGISVVDRLDVLVNGHPASVLLGRR